MICCPRWVNVFDMLLLLARCQFDSSLPGERIALRFEILILSGIVCLFIVYLTTLFSNSDYTASNERVISR
jgi:hypothetical protein